VLQERVVSDLPHCEAKHSLLETLALIPNLAELSMEGRTRAVFRVLDVDCSGYLDLGEILLLAPWIQPGCVHSPHSCVSEWLP
jgi:hypothetical protein